MAYLNAGTHEQVREIYEALKRFPQLVMTSHGWGPARDNDHDVVSEVECLAAKMALVKLEGLIGLIKLVEMPEMVIKHANNLSCGVTLTNLDLDKP